MQRKQFLRYVVMILGGFILFSSSLQAAETPLSEAEIMRNLQAMSQGTYSEAEWRSVLYRTEHEIGQARAEENWTRVIEMTVVKSRAYTIRNDTDTALRLLLDIINEYEDHAIPELKKAYLEAAEIYAQLGQLQAVTDMKNRYRNSPIFDEEIYTTTGGSKRGEPIVMQRPNAAGPNSVSLTALKVAEQKAKYSKGERFPEFSAESWSGKFVSLSECRGQVVLMDFWLPGWHQWESDIAYRKSLYDTYYGQGFQIIGMCVSPGLANAQKKAALYDLPWPLLDPDKGLLRSLGIFGEVSNYLLNRDGVIIARNLYGADLAAAVKRAVLHDQAAPGE